jgi:hypothetical protein
VTAAPTPTAAPISGVTPALAAAGPGVAPSPVPTSRPAPSGGGASGGGICGSIGLGVVLFLCGGLVVARRERRSATYEKPSDDAI